MLGASLNHYGSLWPYLILSKITKWWHQPWLSLDFLLLISSLGLNLSGVLFPRSVRSRLGLGGLWNCIRFSGTGLLLIGLLPQTGLVLRIGLAPVTGLVTPLLYPLWINPRFGRPIMIRIEPCSMEVSKDARRTFIASLLLRPIREVSLIHNKWSSANKRPS